MNKRVNFLINKKFQIKFIIYSLLPVLATQGVTWISLQFYFNKMIEKGQLQQLPTDHFYYQMVNDQITLMKELFLGIGLTSSLLIFVWALLISHKVAGPFYRMTQMLNQDDPDLAQLKFRPGDFFSDVADALRGYVTRQRGSQNE